MTDDGRYGHSVFRVSYLCDPAIHCRDGEHQNLTRCQQGERHSNEGNLHSCVVGMFKNSSTLKHVRLKELNIDIKTSTGNDLKDKIRLIASRAGQQKEENFYCSGCGANAQPANNLDVCFSCHCVIANSWHSLHGPLKKNFQASPER